MADQKHAHPANTDADHSTIKGNPGDGERSSTNEAYQGYKSNQREIGGFSSETGAYRGSYGEREDPTNDVQRDPSQGGPYEGQIDHVRDQNNGPKERPGDRDGGTRK
ncbi:MAG TPA: hypothetical protein VHD90_23030 [Phototrophicaceae bacterium]|nr:hypothetical protein [Phototrophicaceae bacterium]